MTAAYGRADQKGAVIGTQRSLGALARAFGPLASSFGESFFSLTTWSYVNKFNRFLAFFVLGAGPCYCLGAAGLILPFVLLRQSPL